MAPPMPAGVRKRPAHPNREVIALQAAGFFVSLAAGALVVAAPGLGLGLLLGLMTGLVVAGVLRALGTPLLRPTSFVVVSLGLLLPSLPFLIAHWHQLVFARFALAALVVVAIVARLVQLRPAPLKAGGWVTAAFLLYQLVPFASAGGGAYGLLRLANWVMFGTLAFVAYDRVSRRSAASGFLLACFALCAGVALQVVGLLGGTSGGLHLSGSAVAPHIVTRYTSFLLNPNDLGLFLLAGSITAYLVSQHRNLTRMQRAAMVGLSLIFAAGLLLSASRGALLALPLVGVFVAYATGLRRLLGLLAAGIITVALLFALWPAANRPVSATIASLPAVLSGEDKSATLRLTNWREQHYSGPSLIIGQGFGGYATGAKFDVSSAGSRAELYGAATVDNGWLKLLLEEGVVGVALLLGVLLIAFRNALTLARLPEHQTAGLILGCLVIALAFRALSADLFDINPWNFELWLIVGLTFPPTIVHGRTSDRAATRFVS